MRAAAPVLTLLAVLTAGCTEAPASTSAAVPSGPCAAEREQPPEGSQERRTAADLDGDGRTDEVVSWVRGGERVVQAWLATGENAVPEPLFEGDVLATADVDGDSRDEVFAATGAGTGRAFVLEGCRLVPVTLGDRPWSYSLSSAVLVCRGGGVLDLLPVDQQPGERFRLSGAAVATAGPAPAPADSGETAADPVSCP